MTTLGREVGGAWAGGRGGEGRGDQARMHAALRWQPTTHMPLFGAQHFVVENGVMERLIRARRIRTTAEKRVRGSNSAAKTLWHKRTRPRRGCGAGDGRASHDSAPERTTSAAPSRCRRGGSLGSHRRVCGVKELLHPRMPVLYLARHGPEGRDRSRMNVEQHSLRLRARAGRKPLTNCANLIRSRRADSSASRVLSAERARRAREVPSTLLVFGGGAALVVRGCGNSLDPDRLPNK